MKNKDKQEFLIIINGKAINGNFFNVWDALKWVQFDYLEANVKALSNSKITIKQL